MEIKKGKEKRKRRRRKIRAAAESALHSDMAVYSLSISCSYVL